MIVPVRVELKTLWLVALAEQDRAHPVRHAWHVDQSVQTHVSACSVCRCIAFELSEAAYTCELAAEYVKISHERENGRFDSCDAVENLKFEVVWLELARPHG